MSLDQARRKLDELEAQYEDLGHQMMDPQVIADVDQYRRISKAWSDLEEVVTAYREFKRVEREIAQAEELLQDPEMGDLAEEELRDLRSKLEQLEERIRLLLLPKDPNDERNVILEIRPAAGGEEAALFAGDLLRMYLRYAERNGWKVEILNAQETGIGGFSDVVLSIQGRGAYSRLKFESGVHRVQRVPATESGGRIHTSTATVAVLPEVEEVEVEINPNDIEMDVYHSSSAGGQNVQKVATAIRLLHKPTGIVVTCQDERSQLQNKEKAFRMLRARLYELQQQALLNERTEARRAQVGTGDRSEKIRTYNFPDGRVTDHRIHLTVHNLSGVLDGDIEPFVNALITADQAERLRAASSTL
ncbi:MAG: peptide chain release factor 1 [Chthonomonadales bacterium]